MSDLTKEKIADIRLRDNNPPPRMAGEPQNICALIAEQDRHDLLLYVATLERENAELHQVCKDWKQLHENNEGCIAGLRAELQRSHEPKDGLRSLRCANRDLRSALKKICEAYMDDESPTELMKIARSALESQPSETKPSVETFRRSGPELGMSTMCECGATMVHHIAQDHLGNACVCPSHETKPVEPLSQQLAAANTAIAAMANDGWMAFSVEGMSEAQKIVDAYCIKYLLNKDGIVPDPLPNETLAVPQACPDCPLGPGAPCNEQCERGELK